jgi:hypothetical protein
LITVEIAAYLGSSALAFGLYAYFFYWFASQNKKIDVYVQPKIFNWKIKTSLLLIGTVIMLVLFQPFILFGFFGFELPLLQSLAISLVFLPILLFIVLFGLVVGPGIFVLGWAFLGFMGMFMFSSLSIVYWGYVGSVVMIFLALFVSARHAVDTLILRVKEIGYFDVAYQMERSSRIGIGSFILCLLLPTALFTRFIRRATKTGLVKITLSVTPSHAYRGRDVEVWSERYTTVNLERMSHSFEEVQTRIEKMMDRVGDLI